MRGFSVSLLIITFLVFLFYTSQKGKFFPVLEVISPAQIVVDLNLNGIEDEGELIELKNIESFSTKPSEYQSKLAKKLNITDAEALGLGFLAQGIARELLEGKRVAVENNIITVDNKNYAEILVGRGAALFKGGAPSKGFFQNIEKVRRLHLVNFNNKSHKYHRLDCKYGFMAHNSQLLPSFQLPKDAKPCKFCHQNHVGENLTVYRHVPAAKKYQCDLINYAKSPEASFLSGNIQIYLTDFTKVLKPTDKCASNICKALVREINSSQNSIDFAIYGYTKVPEIQLALENAQKRGVKVRFVYDWDEAKGNIYPDTLYLTSIVKDSNHDVSPSIMHDKFFIFDRKKVLTGSANISNTDMSGFNSNSVLIIDSEKVANFYTQEFEQMHCGKFHKRKIQINNKSDGDVSVYFSPKDKAITNVVVPLADGAREYIYIPAFLITHKALADSLVAASKRGVSVRVILDATNTHVSSSKLKMLRASGVQVKTENLAGKLHSKSIIIDDLYTIIGSMNFSRSGESENDENLIIIKNRDIAVFYKTFFQYLWLRIPEKWLKLNARSEALESIGSCSDGIDNDFDGKIDKADESCRAR